MCVRIVLHQFHNIAGPIGLVIAHLSAAREVPGSDPCCAQVTVIFTKITQYAAVCTGCTLTAVLRSTQPSTLRGTVNEY